MSFFDELETRSADQRANDLALALPAQIANAQKLSGNAGALDAVDASSIQTIDDLARLPVLRKSDLVQAQSENGPLGDMVRLKHMSSRISFSLRAQFMNLAGLAMTGGGLVGF